MARTVMALEEVTRLSDQATKALLNKAQTSESTKGGWMMIATILIEAWDLYAISFLLTFIKTEFQPTPFELGWITGAVQFGALVGALLGGYIADRIGRRPVFMATMIMFIILAVLQAFAWNTPSLIIIRLLIGIPLGIDISNGYSYIMESMSKGHRERMGSMWQFMFGLGEVACVLIVTGLYVTGMGHGILWRLGLALGAIPALVLLLGRLHLPETPQSLILHGDFIEAKKSSMKLYNDPLDMLPDQNVRIPNPKVGDFLKVIWADPIKKRASIFGWISNACQGAEFTAWAFYMPIIFAVAGVGVGTGKNPLVGTNMITAAVYTLAMISGFVAPMMLPKIGHKGVSMIGFGMAFIGLIGGAFAIKSNMAVLLVIFACILMWGHYWDASNGMTICSVVAPARFRGTASGFGYVFVKAASFFGAFVFPVMSAKIGAPGATLLVSILSLIGFLAAWLILPEVYGYVDAEEATGTTEGATVAIPAE